MSPATSTRKRSTITARSGGYFRQIECFLAAVEAQDQSLVRSSYADAVNSLAVTLAANRSLETGKVELVE